MAWQDVLAALGGAAQGASQGYGQVQDQRRRDVQLQLQQRQQEMQKEQQKRQAVQQYYETLQGGSKVDPTNPNVQEAVGFGYSFEKDPTSGQLIKPKTPQQALIDVQVESHAQEVARKNAEMKAREEIINTPDLTALPWAQRNKLNFAAGGPFDLTSPQEDLTYNATLKGREVAAQSAARVAEIRAEAERQKQLFTQGNNQDKLMLGLRAQATREATASTMGKLLPPDQLQAQIEQLYQQKLQEFGLGSYAQGGGQAAPPVAGKPVLGGKYTRIQ